jgi:hypothetical protein
MSREIELYRLFESCSESSFWEESLERALAWKLVAFGELLQGPAIAIGITKIDK